MFFPTVFIFNLIICIHFSSQGRLSDDDKHQTKDESKDSRQSDLLSNKQSDNVIKKSDLEDLLLLKNQYIVKNYIDEYETHFALHFTPDWSQVNRFSSPARQSIEIRRQKWNFIFDNLADSVFVKRLDAELEKSGINRTSFCSDIAEIYFTLSDNNFIFAKDHEADKKAKTHPTQEKSIQVFMKAISDFKTDLDKDVDMVQLPKSLYIDLMRKDAHAAIMKQHHDEKIQRLKDAYRKKIQRARDDNEFVDSEVSSY